MKSTEPELTGYGCSTLPYCVLFKLGDYLPVKRAADYKGNNTTNAQDIKIR